MIIFVLVVGVCATFVLLKNEYACLLLRNSTYGFSPLISGSSKVGTLFLGSSMFRQGLDIYALESKFPDSWILAYNGNQPVFENEELLYLARHNFIPKRVFLDMYAFSVVAPSKVSDDRIFLHTDLLFKMQLWKKLNANGDMTLSALWQMFVTSNNENLLAWFLHKPLIEKRYHRGGNILDVAGRDSATILLSPEMEISQLSLRREQVVAIREIVDFCRRNDVQLAFIETPKYQSVVDSRYVSIMESYGALLDSLHVPYYLSEETANKLLRETPSENVTVVPFNSSNPKFFLDYIHLSSDGRREYSRSLMESLR